MIAQSHIKKEDISTFQPKNLDSTKKQVVNGSINSNTVEKNLQSKGQIKSDNQNHVIDKKSQNHRNISGQNGYLRNQSHQSIASRSSAYGENSLFSEKLKEEEETLRVKYKNPKENLCFAFTKGDLFSAPLDASLAHCVSEDFRMGKGIATEFKKRFEGVNELLDQSRTFFLISFL